MGKYNILDRDDHARSLEIMKIAKPFINARLDVADGIVSRSKIVGFGEAVIKECRRLLGHASDNQPVGEVAPMIYGNWHDPETFKGVALVDNRLAPGTKVYVASPQPQEPAVPKPIDRYSLAKALLACFWGENIEDARVKKLLADGDIFVSVNDWNKGEPLNDFLDMAERVLSAQPQTPSDGWIKGNEPPHGGNWLTYRPEAPKDSRVVTLWYDPNHNGWSGHYTVTHYMERPEAPV